MSIAQSTPYGPHARLVKNVQIPMRDGTKLGADVYLPTDPECGPLPVVLEYIPYRKDEVPPGDRFYGELLFR